MSTDSIHETRNFILEQVKYIIFNTLSGNSVKVYLFGSWARLEEKQSSDIDVAIKFESNDDSNHVILMSIRDALYESTIPYRVDIVYLNDADAHIVKKVREEGILWDDPAKD